MQLHVTEITVEIALQYNLMEINLNLIESQW